MYSESFQVQLQHLSDVVLCVQSLADNSDIYRLLPDPTRYAAIGNWDCAAYVLSCAMLLCLIKAVNCIVHMCVHSMRRAAWCCHGAVPVSLLPMLLLRPGAARHLFMLSAAALLEVRRVPELGLLRQRYSEDRLYIIRMKRRSISVGVLDLVPPEAAAADGQQTGIQRVVDKPAAAKICGTGPGSNALDF